jgi:UDP-GlcNAc:undecaprenyl-phosphate GlcNAc-1-phosphate transferase
VREYLFVMVVAAAVTLLLIGPVGALAARWGAVPPTRERDVHRFPIPRLGGVAMLGGFVAALAAASALPRLGRVFELSTDARGILAAAVIICAVGVADDLFNLDALTKFAGQVIAAGVMVASGVQLYWLPLPGGPLVLNPQMAVAVTVFTVLVTVNAVNFVDGLDGLAAGVVGIGALAFFSYSYLLAVVEGLSRMTLPALVSAALAGMCLGFLPANAHPARIFMGDSGSMPIGLLLAGGAIALTGQLDPQLLPQGSVLPALLPLLLPVAVLAIPFIDLLAAVWRRTRAGRSPFAPDKQHLHHRLLDLGHSHRRAVAIMWVWAALVAFGVVLVSLVGGATTVVVVAVTGVGLVLLTLGRPVGLLGRRPAQAPERHLP